MTDLRATEGPARLESLARELRLQAPEQVRLRVAFALACVERVQHLLENEEVIRFAGVLRDYAKGRVDEARLAAAAEAAAQLARHHPGSKSLDGVGHAAVSASYAVANALGGKALQAAEYAAYAAVYGAGGYGATADPQAFETEWAWQCETLASLARNLAGS